MNRLDAIEQILARHPGAAVVLCNGLNARETAHKMRADNHLYLLHAMGEALAVGVGLKKARADLQVVVIDGDGNALMGAPSAAFLPLEGLFHYILDNGCYETTGGQPMLALDFPHSQVVPIEHGKIQSPNPPPPAEIITRFRTWCASQNQSTSE